MAAPTPEPKKMKRKRSNSPPSKTRRQISVRSDVGAVSKAGIFPFLELPGDWNRIHGAIEKTERAYISAPDHSISLPTIDEARTSLSGKCQTPTVLLINRQIKAEAVTILHQIPLVFDYRLQANAYLLMLRYHFFESPPFMSKETVLQLREVRFRINPPYGEHEGEDLAGLAKGFHWFRIFHLCEAWLYHTNSLSNLIRLVIEVGKKKWTIPKTCQDVSNSFFNS
ncbi:hypothetical protein EJ08DRAFT_666084 [Tothia fuscella]|uniref:Uncharacterized protein n=1 Tax=Tothia fuscella TaxID=1048955 RepID=A0A9P4NFJ8_9PEZI|nr:hypothetical protein EJ08DRAFT_666084 [Tothia fuscella]